MTSPKRRLQRKKLGHTGKFPHGRLNKDDEGELMLGIAVDKNNKTVIINFGRPVAWIGLKYSDAIAVSKSLAEKAALLL